MADPRLTIRTTAGEVLPVTLQVDKRLRKTVRWQPAAGGVLLRLPPRFPRRNLPGLLKQIEQQYQRASRKRPGRTDADLKHRADQLLKTAFKQDIPYTAIRWVGNMQNRLGSCTSGGPTDGHIRISDRLKAWPEWVTDYVIVHELAHRLHPDHSPAFWAAVNAAYPRTAEARAWIKGYFFAKGAPYENED